LEYYNLDAEPKKEAKTGDVNSAVVENARKLVSKERYKQIADINKESIAGGLGFGVAGYVIARSKGKNVWVYTGIGIVVGFLVFNLVFRKNIQEKISKVVVEDKPKKESNMSGKPQRRRRRVHPSRRDIGKDRNDFRMRDGEELIKHKQPNLSSINFIK